MINQTSFKKLSVQNTNKENEKKNTIDWKKHLKVTYPAKGDIVFRLHKVISKLNNKKITYFFKEQRFELKYLFPLSF